MKKNSFISLIKIIIIAITSIYIMMFPISIVTNKIDAVLTLIISFVILYKSRNNILVFIIAFFLLYCNYSIVIGEYLVGGNLAAPMIEVKTIQNYGITIRTLLLFLSIIVIFYKNNSLRINDFKLKPKNNIVIFYGLFIILIYILLFGVNRTASSSYVVSITPIYEYSSLLFIFAYYATGELKFREVLLTILFILFILQDFYYGGRATSLQLVFLLLVTIFITKLSTKRIAFGGFVGILVNSLVGVYRQSYSLNLASILGIFNDLKDNLFVFDTSVYAYYASATHVATYSIIGIQERVTSLFNFIISIFIGSKDEIGNVTRYVSSNYYYNLGGGILPTHFYFWLGWGGVILAGIIVVYLINKIGSKNSDYKKIFSIVIIITFPRWYLYSPLSLFRPIFIMTILYILFKASHNILIKIAGRPTVKALKTEETIA